MTQAYKHTVAAEPSQPLNSRGWHARIWRLSWPVILANLTIPLVGTADVWVMGRLSDPKYIGAVALGAVMFSSVYWLFGFLRMGTTGLVAQAYGSGSHGSFPHQAIVAILCRALLVASAIGMVMLLLQWPLKSALFAFFSPSESVGTLAQTYFQIRVWGAPALLAYLVSLGVLFGLQRMQDTLWLSIGFNLTNLLLDLILVLGFDMGVAGVAYGTLVCEWGAAALSLWLVTRALKQMGWNYQIPNTIWQTNKLLELFHVSSNLIVRTFFVQLPFLVGTQLATGLSDVALAAHAILMQLFFIMTYTLDGFAHTAETLAGFYYGAKDKYALRTANLYATVWALLLALFTGLTFLIFGNGFIDSFTVSSEIQKYAQSYLLWLALSPLICVWAFLFDGIFIGTTHIVEMRNAMLLAAALWALLLWATFTHYQYHAVWLSMNFFMLARGIFLACLYPRIEANAESCPTR